MNTLLVIAFKYNDILYALSTEEYKQSVYKKLLIIYAERKRPEDFPCQDLFDEVVTIPYIDDLKKMPINIWKIYSKRNFFKSDIIILSNPILLINKLICKLSDSNTAIWVEDGLMNYYPLCNIKERGNITLKKMVEKVLCIPDIEKRAKHLVTYLLDPPSAKSYWGALKQIRISKDFVHKLHLEELAFLEGKKIFVGQPLYLSSLISIEQYNEKVNKLVEMEKIDYYVPHFWASKHEKIKCNQICLDDYHVTLEFLACVLDFELYAISSSLLYTTKLLNVNVKTHMVDINGLVSNYDIIIKNVNDVIKVS